LGRHTVNFRCHSCGHCCTDVVCLPTPWDVIRIHRQTGEHPENFLEFLSEEEISGVEDDDPTWLYVGEERYMMALRRGNSGCYFLHRKTKHCTIYESRPILCRLYPFKLQESRKGVFKGFSLHDDVGCPKNRDGVVDTAPLYELYLEDKGHHEDYDSLVEAFNARQYTGKCPEDFITLFMTPGPREQSRAKAIGA